MRLEEATFNLPNGLVEFLREVGSGESGFGRVPEVAEGRLTIDAYLKREVESSRGKVLPDDHFPHTTYWLVDDNDRIHGMCRLRHHLNETLLIHGGHIGYYIRSESRGRGFGTCLLALALEEAKNIGIWQALLTVGSDNDPSNRVIEANGGVMEDERFDPDSRPYRRNWIDLGR